jgi:hypothetical protein
MLLRTSTITGLLTARVLFYFRAEEAAQVNFFFAQATDYAVHCI